MPHIIVKTPFKFAHHGYQVEEFEPVEEPRETTDECAELAVREGWAVMASRTSAQQLDERAIEAAPENADAARKRSTKSKEY